VVVADADSRGCEAQVIARWRNARLPELDEFRAHLAIHRRLAEGINEEELYAAIEGASARSKRDGWTGATSPFAVVMGSVVLVREYARQGREAQAARERVVLAERERRTRDREQRECENQAAAKWRALPLADRQRFAAERKERLAAVLRIAGKYDAPRGSLLPRLVGDYEAERARQRAAVELLVGSEKSGDGRG
jgi:hypothetical protein